jgi:hypothetical protein
MERLQTQLSDTIDRLRHHKTASDLQWANAASPAERPSRAAQHDIEAKGSRSSRYTREREINHQSGGEEDEAAATDEEKAETPSEATSEREASTLTLQTFQRHSLCVAL